MNGRSPGQTRLYFIVPCYNDAEVLPVSVPAFLGKLDALSREGLVSRESRLVLLDDGSSDGTWTAIEAVRTSDGRVVGIKMAHNAGEQNTLLAGLSYAETRCDCAITMDSDLQDDVNAVDEMLRRFFAGDELVLGVRSRRKDDPFFERLSSGLFYRLMTVAGTGQIPEHANYRLMSRKAIGQLLAHTETYYYLPCVVSNMGLRRSVVYHERFARAAGSSGYTVIKKLRLALDAVFTHSAFPLRFISAAASLSALLFAVSAGFALAGLAQGRREPLLWAAASLFFFAFELLLLLRVLGAYLYKTFAEARRAPPRQTETVLGDGQSEP